MSIEQMRDALRSIYASRKWYYKVEKMSDKQVYAVYNKMLREDKIKN